MLLKYLVNALKNRIYLKLISLSIALQLISLFRNYPSNHPCGRVLEIVGPINVLINCDSSVYMKDAQNPSRLFNGESVYQDRPLPTLVVSALSKFWEFLNLPNFSRNFIGNSGNVTNYYFITYFFFILLSTAILILTCFIGISTFSELTKRLNASEDIFVVVATIFVLLISMNELTKTFFWTPGSQMFNLLLPVYLFALIQKSQSTITTKVFATNLIFFVLLLFSYAFFIMLIIPLLFLNWRNFKSRLFWIAPIPLLYFLYPSFIKILGGEYYSFGFGYRRLYVWIIDSYFEDRLYVSLLENLIIFFQTFPFIPIVLFISVLIFIPKSNLFTFEVIRIYKIEILILIVHLLMLALYGYYSRRLTYPIILFVVLIFLKYFIQLNKNLILMKISIIIIPVTIFSWAFTNGPLQ